MHFAYWPGLRPPLLGLWLSLLDELLDLPPETTSTPSGIRRSSNLILLPSRYYVRTMEVVQSVKLVRQTLDKYEKAEGSHRAELPRTLKLPQGECYVETECPRGAMGFLIVGADAPIPHRMRAKSSCFCNLAPVSDLCRGCLIADIPAIVGSLDIVMGEIDR